MMSSKDWARNRAKYGDIDEQVKKDNIEFEKRQRRKSEAEATKAMFGGMYRRSRDKHFF